MEKRPVVASAFHEEKFNKLVLVLFKANGKIDQLFFAVIKEKFREFLHFAAYMCHPHSESMRRSFVHTQIDRRLTAKAHTGPDQESENGTVPVSMTNTNKFCFNSQILRPKS